jgi:hypothetical protein
MRDVMSHQSTKSWAQRSTVRNSCGACSTRESLLREQDEPPVGAHLMTRRLLYWHHGIYIGAGYVIHYAGLASGLRRGPVENVPLADFSNGSEIWVRHDVPRFSHHEIVRRAFSRLGEHEYSVFRNNCEHLCQWVLFGEHHSPQVQALRELPILLWRATAERVLLAIARCCR